MKYVLCLTLLLTALHSKSQDLDTLGKYCYKLSVLDTNKRTIGSATGFFVQYQSKCYLVSSRSVFTGQKMYTGDTVSRSSQAYLVYQFTATDKRTYTDTIPVRKIVADSPFHYYFQAPDVYAYPVNLPPGAILNLLPGFNTALPDSSHERYIEHVLTFGYPEAKLTMYKFKSFLASPRHPAWNITTAKHDTIRLTHYYALKPNAWGLSGSPVFFVYNYNGTRKVYFAGLFSGGFEFPDDYSMIVKPDVVRSIFEKQFVKDKKQ